MVSIVVPVHNAAGFIADTIKMVCEQTYKDWELILVDDASTDGSANIIEKIIIGEIDEDDTPNPNAFRFILKNGTDIKLKNCIINKTMSFGSTNRY